MVHTEGAQVSFSQPACPDHMLLGSQLLGTPGASQVITLHHKDTPRIKFKDENLFADLTIRCGLDLKNK